MEIPDIDIDNNRIGTEKIKQIDGVSAQHDRPNGLLPYKFPCAAPRFDFSENIEFIVYIVTYADAYMHYLIHKVR